MEDSHEYWHRRDSSLSYADLQAKYPEILGKAEIRILPGWFGIIDAMCAQLILLGPPYVEIRGVYEKFGSLRLHNSTTTETKGKLLYEAYVKSLNVCENCGMPAKMGYPKGEKAGWVKCLCNTCMPLFAR